MNRRIIPTFGTLAALAACALTPSPALSQDIVFNTLSGFQDFRTQLGANRRQVGWDAVRVDGTDANPATQVIFPNAVARIPENRFTGAGVPYSAPTLIGRDNANGLSGFAAINPNFGANFQSFSPGNSVALDEGQTFVDLTFVAGGQPAVTSAFGAIFLDVEKTGISGLEFFDLSGNSLGTEFAPLREGGPAGNASFIGKSFDTEKIARVRLFAGEASLLDGFEDVSSTSLGVDLVAFDDIVFAAPQAVPEPSACAAAVAGGALLLALRRRKK